MVVLMMTLLMMTHQFCFVCCALPVSSTSGSRGTAPQAGQQAAGPSTCLPRPAVTAAMLCQDLLMRRHSCHALRSCLQENTTLAVSTPTSGAALQAMNSGSYLSSMLLMDVTTLGSAGE
jgi:hypothetical protein